MRIYISGKIGRQMPDEATLQSFAHAEQVLQAMGFETFNPTTSGLGSTAEILSKAGTSLYREMATREINSYRQRSWYDCILMLDLEVLSWYDAICMLPGWQHSPGACAERAVADAMGLRIYELTEYDTLVFIRKNEF